MAAHPVGDTSMIDAAIRWNEAAVAAASDEKAKATAQAGLDMARLLKQAALKAEPAAQPKP